MNKSFVVTSDKRYIKRKSYKALNSLVKILTEIITNSDDSYRRLKGNNALDHSCRIDIYIDKKTREILVIDHAEGMSPVEIENNFQRYGADKSGRGKGHKTRGLFGQGATDVLFTQKDGKIISFKNEATTEATFKWIEDDKREIFLNDLKNEENSLRKKYNIFKNGTIVSFTLDSKIRMPQKSKKIADDLSQFYMLRLVMEDKTRKVVLNIKNNKKNDLLERLYYNFPELAKEDIIYQGLIDFDFESKKIKGDLKLTHIKDKQEKEKKHGELKILVFDDEKNVYDNTFFKAGDRYPGVEKINGYLKLHNTAEIIREKLNLERPEEILTDTRDGFNKEHDFYKKLDSVIYPIIEKHANKLNVVNESKISSNDFKSQKKLFNELNKYLKEELEGIKDLSGNVFEKKPPHDGFDFARDRIKITLGKKYSLRIIVNNKIFKKNYKIFFKNKSGGHIFLEPNIVKIGDLSDSDVSCFNIYLEGKKITKEDCIIEAYNPETNVQKKLFVSVVPETIYYPKNPIEFHPNYLNARVENKSKLNLYVDIKTINLESEIILSSTNKKINLINDKIKIKESNLIDDNVALIEVFVKCNDKNQKGKVLASCNNYVSEADIIFSENEDDLRRGSGFLSGWELTNNPDAMWQKFLHPKTGKTNINTEHFINKEYFGEKPTLASMKKNKISQKYLAETLSDELAQYTTKEMARGGKIGSDTDGLFEEYQKQKNKFAKIIYKYKLD